jgi:uncharacterized radical SAM superfamily Fe-S cluster-containing enzyme
MSQDANSISKIQDYIKGNGLSQDLAGEDEIIADESKSVCPECLKLIDCDIIFRENKVYLRKTCDDHGTYEVLIYSDVNDYVNALKFNKPGQKPLHYQGKVSKGCPDDCGICEDHQQHTCVGVVEITDRCNLNCPVCFAGTKGSFSIPFEKVQEMIDLYVKCEGHPEVLQISGGEPTIHPEIFEILEYMGTKGIKYPLLNTNGIKLADKEFAERLSKTIEKEESYINAPIIYLQFDGFSDDIYTELRGKPLLDIKLQALENCREFGMNVAIIPTIVNGVNDHEMGAIVDFALNDKNIKMVNFQPGAQVGRYSLEKTEVTRITIPELLEKLEIQTKGLIKKPNFINVPCPFPICSVCSYFLKMDGQVISLTDLIDVEDYMDGIINRTLPDLKLVSEIRDAFDDLMSMAAVGGSEKTNNAICTTCGIAIPNIETFVDNVTVISVHAMMDEYNFMLKRAMKCCVTEILPDGNMIPFCVYNVLYRKDLKPVFRKMC